MARLKLELQPDPEISVIGISSHVKDYRLCWSINRAMGINLTRRRPPIQDESNGIRSSFNAFDHRDEETSTSCTLVNNHGTDGVLLKDLRQADYFLVVDQDWADRPETVLEKVRSAEFVLTAFPLEFDQLKDGHKLLL
jgi:hypothetical protein